MSKYKIISASEAALMFGALSNENRLKLFLRIASCCLLEETGGDEQQCYVGDLGNELDIAPSTISHHLKELRHAGLITTKRRGQRIECKVDADKLATLSEFFKAFHR